MKLQINGSEVFYGTGSGTPNDTAQTLVFVHGAGFDHTIWVMPARYFARHGWRVVAVDLPGHGRSEGPPLTSSLPRVSRLPFLFSRPPFAIVHFDFFLFPF